jgi:predicted amidophosphoribosyltransferase
MDWIPEPPKSTGALAAERISKGLCPRCGKPPEGKTKLCPICREKGRGYVAKSRRLNGRSDQVMREMLDETRASDKRARRWMLQRGYEAR